MRTLTIIVMLALPAVVLAEEKPKLEIELTAPKEVYPDERIAVKVVIRNAGKEEVHILKAVDGAHDGLRNMVDYKWKVTKNGQAVPKRTDIVRIDDLVNTIREEDLVAVPAGKVMSPEAPQFDRYYKFNEPGKYVITLTYEFDPDGSDKADPDVLKKMQKLPAAKATGKVEVTILPFPPDVAAVEDRWKAASAKFQLLKQFADAVAGNPNSTAAERDAAGERLKRAAANLDAASEEYNAKMAEFRKKREESRKQK